MSTMESIRSVYVHGFTANIPVYENYVRAQDRAEARFDKALAEYRDAVLDEAAGAALGAMAYGAPLERVGAMNAAHAVSALKGCA